MSQGVTLDDPKCDSDGNPIPANYADRIIDLFINFYRQVFSTNNDYRYTQDERTTDILIYDTFAGNIDSIGRKPTLVTDLEPVMKTNSFLDDRAGTRHPNYEAGTTLKTDLFTTALIVHSVSQQHDESRNLSFMVGTVTYGLEDVLLSSGLHEISVETVQGKPVKLITSNRGELWSTPTVIRVSFQDNWANSIIGSEVLDQIRLSISIIDDGGPSGC